jgi:hypothetical protein
VLFVSTRLPLLLPSAGLTGCCRPIGGREEGRKGGREGGEEKEGMRRKEGGFKEKGGGVKEERSKGGGVKEQRRKEGGDEEGMMTRKKGQFCLPNPICYKARKIR